MTEEEQIKKGFNAGYKLEQLDPKLSKTLQQGFTDKDHPYAKGFTAGSLEYAKEISTDKSSYRDTYLNEMKNSNSKSSGKEKSGKEPDMEH